MRSKYLDGERQRKMEERVVQGLPPQSRVDRTRTKMRQMFGSERCSVSVEGRVVSNKKLEEDSDFEGDMEKPKER